MDDREGATGVDQLAGPTRLPWWLRFPAASLLIAVLLLLDRWIGGVRVLALLVLAGAVLLLGAAVLLPGVGRRWFLRP
jgi:hypothetical protein